ncbi:hypothetical protein P8A18_02455 [Streptomyces castrisilvae]|uniref:Secreted protein n=1 Tax=Streptomyces castrisilvae TaxID=3033811 RepID=A0ABY9HCY1_9ACTN|nr:hypothetical protein [Streptomyces sp. Mut1]WLQ32376.1 hypothetical protein P8A18_02455 [Streptomyces sp. Mut1]
MAPHPTPSSRRLLRPAVAVSPAGFSGLAPSTRGPSGKPDASAHAGKATTTRVTDATGTAVSVHQATVIDGTRWTSPGGAQAAVSVRDDIRKAMVK